MILDHGGGRTTLYGHMSRFGSERVGQRVSQGAVIGYVGMSGLATGPHLHYEFRINGVHQNPLKMTMPPPAHRWPAPELAAFRARPGARWTRSARSRTSCSRTTTPASPRSTRRRRKAEKPVPGCWFLVAGKNEDRR